jgi:urease gamma subunit
MMFLGVMDGWPPIVGTAALESLHWFEFDEDLSYKKWVVPLREF